MTATVAVFPKFRAFDSNGVPLAGGLLYTYQAGTTTPQATYTDQSATSQNANPVVLDASGSASVWLGSGLSYKFVLKDSAGNTQWTADNVTDPASSVLAQIASTTAGQGAGLVGFAPSGTGAVGRNVQAKLQEFVSVMDFGAKGDGVTDDTGAIQAALDATANGGNVLFPLTTSNTYLVSSALKFYSGQKLMGAGGVGISTGGTILRLTASSTSVIEPKTPTSTTWGFGAEGIYFDAQGNAPCAVKFYNTSHSTLKNCATNCTTANGAGVLLDANVTLAAYFNLIENCRCYGTGTGGAGIRFQNGANVNTILGGKCGSGCYYGLDFLSQSSGNIIIGTDLEGITTACVHADASGNVFENVHMESTPTGFLITANGSLTAIINPTMASTVTTPVNDSSMLGIRMYATPDTNSTGYLAAGAFALIATYLSGGSNVSIDPKLALATSNSLVNFFKNTNTSGLRELAVYKGDGTTNLAFLMNAGTEEFTCGDIIQDNGTGGGAYRKIIRRGAAPSTGTWSQGDVVFTTGPVASGTMGWVCVTGGSPGTWKTWGTISA